MSEFFQSGSVVNNDVCSTDLLENMKKRNRLHHQLYESVPIKDK